MEMIYWKLTFIRANRALFSIYAYAFPVRNIET